MAPLKANKSPIKCALGDIGVSSNPDWSEYVTMMTPIKLYIYIYIYQRWV